MLKFLKNNYFLYCLIVSFFVLLIVSNNSFLYSFNEWCDSNAFFTVGKSMMNGVVPYRDLFEQKGLLLFFIYGIGYLISNYSFYGVFLIEVVFFTVFLYFIHKIISLYFDNKYSLLIIPLFSFIVVTSNFFYYGGSCEEFCLPFISCSLYYFLKHFRSSKLNNKEIFINGIMAGCVFMMKYTVLSIWICFVLFIFIDYIKNKNFKSGFIFLGLFLLGMILPTIICFMYLFATGAVDDYIFCYFTYNIFIYYKEYSNLTFFNKIGMIPSIFQFVMGHDKIYCMILIYLSPISIIFLKKNKYFKNNLFFKISLIITILFVFFITVWSFRFYPYYYIIFEIFSIFTFLLIFRLFENALNKVSHIVFYLLALIVFVVSVVLCYYNACFKDMIGKDKSYYFQFEFADYINQYDNPTLLNLYSLDAGLYTTTGIIPSTKYFHSYNILYDTYPVFGDKFNEYITNKETMFILADVDFDEENLNILFDNKYELVLKKDHFGEYGNVKHAYLYQRLD